MDGDMRLPRQRQRDLDAAEWARQSNRFLLKRARTRFQLGQTLFYRKNWKVEIIEVMPTGYIVVPGRHSFAGEWLEPICVTNDLYRFRRLGSENHGPGQAREEELDLLEEFEEHGYRFAA
ncbi:hypothetical protein SBBP1_410003 [Burkholderiales bacterium]|nr:hypothetical protein SBBP1_410003 [Burkholderiales bacterium]